MTSLRAIASAGSLPSPGLLPIAALTVCLASSPALAQDASCPARGISDRFICFETGDVATPANRTSLVYTPTRAFVAGSEICAFVDVSAEIEQGGWDQVFLRFAAGTDPVGTSFVDYCLAGDLPEVCGSDASPGCLSAATVTYDLSGTYCWQPPAGTTDVTISVFVKTLDDEYQCGECDGGGSPGIDVARLEVTGCNGLPSVSLCGNGVLDVGEGCDDANTVGLDGCSATCTIEPGAICNAARTTCGEAAGCDAVRPGTLAIPYCYGNNADIDDSPLTWTWNVAANGEPLWLSFDVSGGLELFSSAGEYYDALWLAWEDDRGGTDLVSLNFGQGMSDSEGFDVWSHGVLPITPSAGATRVTATVVVESDGSVSCAQSPTLIDPLTVDALSLSSCGGRVVTSYDSLNAFTDALPIKGCYTTVDFNDASDGEIGPFFGDGYILDTDTPIALSVEASPYPSTFAAGDGTPALDPQLPEEYLVNSRLVIEFWPEPAKAIGMSFIDVGDIGGRMGMEAYLER